MTKQMAGWFLFVCGLMVVAALLVGDVLTLWRSGGTMDGAFITGMVGHVFTAVGPFVGGLIMRPPGAAAADSVSIGRPAGV